MHVCVCVSLCQPVTANYVSAGSTAAAHYAAVPIIPASLAAATYTPVQPEYCNSHKHT